MKSFPLPAIEHGHPIPDRKVRKHSKTPRAENPWLTLLRQVDTGDSIVIPHHQYAEVRRLAAKVGLETRYASIGWGTVAGYDRPVRRRRVSFIKL